LSVVSLGWTKESHPRGTETQRNHGPGVDDGRERNIIEDEVGRVAEKMSSLFSSSYLRVPASTVVKNSLGIKVRLADREDVTT
jgi:hypothetical protein